MRDEELELRWFFAVIRRWAWLIVGCTLLALIVAFVIVSRMPPAYEATAILLVVPAEQTSTSSEYTTLMAGELLAMTYSQMLKEQSTLQTTITRLGLEDTPDALAKRITTEPVKDTQLVRVTVRDSSPARAALIANTIAEIFTDYTKTLREDRYRGNLLSKEATIEAQRKLVEDTQSQVNTVDAAKVSDETELARLQGLLADYQNTSRTLQQDHQSLQLLVDRVKDNVKIVEGSRAPGAVAVVPYAKMAEVLRGPAADDRVPYTAIVTLLVDQDGGTAQTDYSGILASERLAGTYAQMMSGRSVLEAAIAKLGTGQKADDIAAMVKAEPIAGTQLVRLQVKGTGISKTARLADAIAQAFVDQIQGMLGKPYVSRLAGMEAELTRLSTLIDTTQAEILERNAAKLRDESELARLQSALAEYRSDYRTSQQDYEQLRLTTTQLSGAVVIAEPAHEPQKPSANHLLYVVLAALVAMLTALGIAFLIEYLDESIKAPENVSQVLGLNTIGMIERFGKEGDKPIVAAQPQSPAAEAFRILAANIRLSSMDRQLRTILVTSPTPGDGKSVVAANLAVAMASAGLRVVAVDADLRMPRLHSLFGLNRGRGLTDALVQGDAKDHFLKFTAVEGVRVLTSGTLSPDPVEAISSPQTKKLLADLAEEADLVIIDSPPVLAVADTTILAAGVDGVLLVLRAGRSRNQPAQQAVVALRQARTHLLGVVLNGVAVRRKEYYGYYNTRGKTAVPDSQLRKAVGSARFARRNKAASSERHGPGIAG